MKRLAAIAVLLALVFPAAAIEYKTVDIRRTGNSPVRESFYGGDSIGFAYYLTEENETYDMTGWDMVTWELASYTNSAECWMSVTGRIDNAEGGEISVETMLPLSVVPVGQYKGYVKAVKLTAGGDAVASQRTVVEQTVQVRYGNTELSPDAIDPSELIAQGAFVRQAALDEETRARIAGDEANQRALEEEAQARIEADAALSNAVAGVQSDVDGLGDVVTAISNKVAGLDGDLPDFDTFATKGWAETNFIQRELVEQVRQEHSGGRVDTNEVLTVYYDSPGQSLYVKNLRVDQLTDYNGNAIGGTGSGGTAPVSGDYLPAIKGTDEVYRVTAGAGVGFAGDVEMDGAASIGGTAFHSGDIEMQSNAVHGAVAYLFDSDAYAAYGPTAYEDYHGLVQYYSQNRIYPYGMALNTLGDILHLGVRGSGSYIEMRHAPDAGSELDLGAAMVTATGTVEVGVLKIGGESYNKLRGRLHGGYYLTPARWEWATRTSYENATNYSNPFQRGSWRVAWATVSRTQNAVIVPNILRNEEWEPFEIEEMEGPATLEEAADGGWRIAWDDPYETGTVITVKARIGTWKETVSVTNTESTTTNRLVGLGPTVGSLRERMTEIKQDWMTRTGGSIQRIKNFGRDTSRFELNTNFWASELDLSGVSVWNDDPGYYYTKPLTLVSSNLAVGARHWIPSAGRQYGWLGTDGAMHYSTVVDVKGKNPDLAVVRLDPSLDTNVVATYGILSSKVTENQLGNGDYDDYWATNPDYLPYVNLPVVACAQSCRSFLMSTEDFNYIGSIIADGFMYVNPVYEPESYPLGPWECVPLSRKEAVGGDSGHPIFAWDGNELALVGCYWKSVGAPHLGWWWNDIRALADAAGGDADSLRLVTYAEWPDYHSWRLSHNDPPDEELWPVEEQDGE